jgi:hypothetical protein
VKHAKLVVLLASGLFTAVLAAVADEKKAEAPAPPPEVKKLGFFLGTWSSDAEVKPNSFIPAGHYTWTDKCDWFPGGFHLVCYSAGKSPMGLTHGLAIFAYNPEEKAYTYLGIDNSGLTVASRGTVDGSNWTFTNQQSTGGKSFHGRYSITTSATSYAFKHEISRDGRKWTVVMEGNAKRPEKKKRPERELERERQRSEPHEMK